MYFWNNLQAHKSRELIAGGEKVILGVVGDLCCVCLKLKIQKYEGVMYMFFIIDILYLFSL
jgi:hypothetical protein